MLPLLVLDFFRDSETLAGLVQGGRLERFGLGESDFSNLFSGVETNYPSASFLAVLYMTTPQNVDIFKLIKAKAQMNTEPFLRPCLVIRMPLTLFFVRAEGSQPEWDTLIMAIRFPLWQEANGSSKRPPQENRVRRCRW
jgi:hypothetical protein